MKSVLFVCNLNSVRSPMASGLLRSMAKNELTVDSAGVYEGWLDPFVAAVMEEAGMPLESHEPKPMKNLDLSQFDLIVALTPEAAKEAQACCATAEIEEWEVENPSNVRGGRDEAMAAYRSVFETLKAKISDRFKEFCKNP